VGGAPFATAKQRPPAGQTPMLRLFRLVILLTVAFVAGFFYSEMTWLDRCKERGGEARDGVCFGMSQ
jgi:hypothetical protein